MHDDVLIIGAGKLGRQIALDISNNGENVTVLDSDSQVFSKLEDFSGFTHVGDGTNIDTLKSLNISEKKMVVITTDDDNVNLFIADICSQIFDVINIFVRLSDSTKARIIGNESIHPICPFVLSLDYFNSFYKKEVF